MFESNTVNINMDALTAKATGQLTGLVFQLEETLDDLDNVNALSLEELQTHVSELKGLRVQVVQVNSELKNLRGTDGDTTESAKVDGQVAKLLNDSKTMLDTLKSAVKAKQDRLNNHNYETHQRKLNEDLAQKKARKYAFDQTGNQLKTITNTLFVGYDISADDDTLSHEVILKRKDMKSSYAVEFDRGKVLLDRLLDFTDVDFVGKDLVLKTNVDNVGKLDKLKIQFEEKLHQDLEENDLTDQKMMLATKTEVDIGEFSGSLEKGLDYYSFKSKFLKSYRNHPKSLLVEWLVNNHLVGRAKECVGTLDDLDEIWTRLESNFGNTEQLLAHQYSKVLKMGAMNKQKGFEAKQFYLQKLVNVMQDAYDLAVDHDLTFELYYSNKLPKLVGLLDNNIQNKWYKTVVDERLNKPEKWTRLMKLLNAELKIIQVRVAEMLDGDRQDEKKVKESSTSGASGGSGAGSGGGAFAASEVCSLCGSRHPNNSEDFTFCKKFLTTTPRKRGDMVRQKHCCLQCLLNVRFDSEHDCTDEWLCPNISHSTYNKKLHFLLCGKHAGEEINKQLYEGFKQAKLQAEWQKRLHSSIFVARISPPTIPAGRGGDSDNNVTDVTAGNSEDVALHSHAAMEDTDVFSVEEHDETAAYILQPYPLKGRTYNLMFDTGCQKFVCRSDAVNALPEEYKTNTKPGPIYISGVGCQHVESTQGQFTIRLPIHDGRLVSFNGICLDVITGAMPPYPYKEVRKTIVADYVNRGGKECDLPDVPLLAGGETDFLIGILFNYFIPRLVHILPTGLAIYKSMFVGTNGTRGCIGGSHELFRQCERQFLESNNNIAEFRIFLQQQIQLFNTGQQVCLDASMFTLIPCECESGVKGGCESSSEYISVLDSDTRETVCLLCRCKKFNAVECAGSIEYRCIECRGCTKCKKGEYTESISFQAELEQKLLEDTVEVDFTERVSSATLPFISDPEESLVSNRDIALKVYRQQVKKLAKDPEKLAGVLRSEQKLQDAGHVDWVSNLSEQQQKMLSEGVSHWFPWRFVQNPNSLSTPYRVVFDGSSVTKSGRCLNDIVAKGVNTMNHIVELFIRFCSYVVALHTDIKQMYNVIKLKPVHWKYQRYLWDKLLNPNNDPGEKCIKTIIYGNKSSGNQAECAIRKTAIQQQETFPKAADSVIHDAYMDDIATGVDAGGDVVQFMSNLVELLGGGGFGSKGFTVSGSPPPPELSADGVRVGVLGLKWLSEDDMLQLAVGRLNFARKVRGKKPETDESFMIPEKLTKQICAGKVGELFDLIGLAAPVIAGFKIDLHELFYASYEWDTPLSSADHEMWVSNFGIMESLSDCSWPRAVIPHNLATGEIELIGCGDASEKIACAACYVRCLKDDGTYSCRLVLAKTKIVPEDDTLPRGELLGVTMNTHVTEIVKRALKRFNIARCIYVLDSEIVLHWLASKTKQLKPYVRNRVIEVLRFTSIDQWYHIESALNPADLGTRKGVSVADVDGLSRWSIGAEWMYKYWEDLLGTTLKNIDHVKLKNNQIAEVKKEMMKLANATDLCVSEFHLVREGCNSICSNTNMHRNMCLATTPVTKDVVTTLQQRYQFMNYMIDPNKYTFAKVVRIIAVVMKFVTRLLRVVKRDFLYSGEQVPTDTSANTADKKFLSDVDDPDLELSDQDRQNALLYFFRKASEEVKSFIHPKVYKKDSFEMNGIIYYSGRVLNNDIVYECEMSQKMIDLSKDTFIVPMVDRFSPVAYAIVNQYHWEDKNVRHKGIETTIRAIMGFVHILRVRDLVKSVKKNCKRCRYILKRTVEIVMGPASSDQLCVAPPFYVTQTDLCGPFKAYSSHNKRATIKVYITVFVCCTTGMTSLKIMEGYDSTQFLHAFSRFACELGFPKKLLVDEGSQIICGCENVVLNISDMKGNLSREHGVEFRTCPVGGHNYNGKAERKVKTLKEIMIKTVHLARLSVLEWETLCAEMSNSINNLPIAIGNETKDLESLDLLTPNRLRLARNNTRGPVGPLEVTDKLEKLMRLKTDTFQSWWETWLVSAVPKLMPSPKWFDTDRDVQQGDVVLFLKDEGARVGEYKYGMIDDVKISRDGRIRSVTIRYRNSNENIDRTTNRAVRSLVIIHRVDEIDLMEELGNAVTYANGVYCMMGC